MKIVFDNANIEYKLLIDNYKEGSYENKKEAEFQFLTKKLGLNNIKNYQEFSIEYDNQDNIIQISIFDNKSVLKKTYNKNDIRNMFHENKLELKDIRSLDILEDKKILVLYTSEFCEYPSCDEFELKTIQKLFKNISQKEFEENFGLDLEKKELNQIVKAIYGNKKKKNNKVKQM